MPHDNHDIEPYTPMMAAPLTATIIVDVSTIEGVVEMVRYEMAAALRDASLDEVSGYVSARLREVADAVERGEIA